MKALTHVIVILAALAVFAGIPLAAFANVQGLVDALTGQDVDLVSSATTIQNAPSGTFTVYINEQAHADEKVLQDWETFFSGEDAPLIMEDVSCVAAAGDAAGIEMAQSLQSRLPENQMKLRIEEGTLAVSKAEKGLFDVLVLSDEAAASYDTSALEDSTWVRVVHR